VRFVVLGAGAVGGVVGGRLFQYGQDVVLLARGDHARVIASDGLTLASATGVVTLPVPVVESPGEVDWQPGDVVLMAVKSQETDEALVQLSASTSTSTPVVCMQNGVANEPAALRRFENVYAMCVMCPAAHLEPGVVVAESSPVTALLDIGRYPEGLDRTAEAVAEALNASTCQSVPRRDIMRWKYTKLLSNLVNAVDALCGPAGRSSRLAELAREEGRAVLRTAGIAFVSQEEDSARRGDLLSPTEVVGYDRGGSSSWQSLARSTGTIETDYLNGEIVLLGRLHGVATPVNELLRQLADKRAREHGKPGTTSPEEILALLGQAVA
jgi:2-dehydropantoate 2-reductase